MRQDAKRITGSTHAVAAKTGKCHCGRGWGGELGQGQREAHMAMTWSCPLQMMPLQLVDLGPSPRPLSILESAGQQSPGGPFNPPQPWHLHRHLLFTVGTHSHGPLESMYHAESQHPAGETRLSESVKVRF
eukprot:jgi/Botrbrau1/20870/Bobra.0135s0005.1